jgi:Mn-dependent DtxR family transcriptional regulator
MPAFLVQKSGKGFTAKDMEMELAVKPSTAKKYIRILQETGMIEPSQNEGKKSTLKLSIDKIMRRYAEEKSKKTSQISV